MTNPFERPSSNSSNIKAEQKTIIKTDTSQFQSRPELKEGDVCTISKKDYDELMLDKKFGPYHPQIKFIIKSTFISRSGRPVVLIQLKNYTNDDINLLSDQSDSIDRSSYTDKEFKIRLDFLDAIS